MVKRMVKLNVIFRSSFFFRVQPALLDCWHMPSMHTPAHPSKHDARIMKYTICNIIHIIMYIYSKFKQNYNQKRRRDGRCGRKNKGNG